MNTVFLKLLSMSVTAGWLILAVIFLRLLFKKAPKWLSCVLWAIVAVRLMCPFFPQSPFSLMPRTEAITFSGFSDVQDVRDNPSAIGNSPPATDGISGSYGAISPVSDSGNGAAIPKTILSAGTILWSIGLVCLLGYALASIFRLHRIVREAVPLRDNILLCDAVTSPFIMGIFKPRIYLSSDTDHAQMPYIIAHEKAHIARRDHWWKALGYLLLAVYWFHPLVWAAYILLCRDIELACDEKVVKDMDLSGKKAYSSALLACSMHGKTMIVYPPSFGEVGIKERIRTILHYKKPAFWIIVASITVCIITALCFLTDPSAKGTDVETADHPDEPRENDAMIPQSGSSNENPASLPAESDEPADRDLDAAVAAAILSQNSSSYSGNSDSFICCDFAILDKSETSYGNARSLTLYGWALYQEYLISENGIEDIAGIHIPVSMTFDLDENGYHLKEYWEPRDGSYFVPDIRDKFPAYIAEDGIDSQKYILPQIQSCYRQAVESCEIDTDTVISHLLDIICSSPKISSNPQDYIREHDMEYRELLYYGGYTLDYYHAQKETGLRNEILRLVSEELS